MSLTEKSLSVASKLGIVLLLLGAFTVGLGGVLYTALRSPEVQVPEIVGKDYQVSEKELVALNLKIRKRTDRFSQETPNTVLEQTPRAGEMVKAGQTISVVISRAQAEGDEKPAEVKKETVNDKPKDIDEPSEVDKARQKRKAANAIKNANVNKNLDSNNANNPTRNGNTAFVISNAKGLNNNTGVINSNARSNPTAGNTLIIRPGSPVTINRNATPSPNVRSTTNSNRRP